MNKFSNFVVKNKKIIFIISLLLLIPSIIGLLATKTNYDILVYLPSDIETLRGQNILKDDFKMGAFSVSLVDNDVSGKSKMIFMIDSKTKPNEVKVESKKEETKKTLWDKIKGLFK